MISRNQFYGNFPPKSKFKELACKFVPHKDDAFCSHIFGDCIQKALLPPCTLKWSCLTPMVRNAKATVFAKPHLVGLELIFQVWIKQGTWLLLLNHTYDATFYTSLGDLKSGHRRILVLQDDPRSLIKSARDLTGGLRWTRTVPWLEQGVVVISDE